MSPGSQMLLSGALSFGVPLALAARELFAMRRRRGGWSPPGDSPAPKNPSPLSWRPSLPPVRPVSETFGLGDDGDADLRPTRVRVRELA